MSMNLDHAQVVCRRGTIDTSRMMVAAQILGMSSAELQALIHRELGQNRASEMVEYDVCQRCGHILDGPRCPHCRLLQHDWDIASGEHDDPVAGVPPPVTMAEYLLLALQDQLPTDDAPLAEYLVASLDEDGRLACTTVEAVDLFGVDPDRVERAIHCLQDMEPSGIGARDLRECLLIQLSCLERAGRTPPFVREVMSDFLPQLAMHRYGEIASALGTTVTSVTRVGEFIWRNLHPFPARGYMAARVLGAGPLAGHILPDVIISRREQSDGTLGYDVQVVESQRFEVQLNPSHEAIDTNVNDCASAVSLEERRQIHHAIARGREFIGHISQRQQMLARITQCLVAMQRDGLEAGIHRFHPMTRAQIAAHLGMHESAVRRAISGK
jgi:RNA polymerase sigma-54 factor